jgi:hypothetical protein
MSDASPALDEAFERMAGSDFELPNGFVNHGPMACEALAALGHDDRIDGWARWFAEMVGEGPTPRDPGGPGAFAWSDALGDYQRLPEWIGFFKRVVDDDGWSSVVEIWVPRLVPGMATALFHGLIRTAHALRAVAAVDTAARRAELARALGYWAARFRPGEAPADLEPVVDPAQGVTSAAAHGARRYVDHPSIFYLHGVTGAMAVSLLLEHLTPDAGRAALAQVRAEHGNLYRGPDPLSPVDGSGPWAEGVALAAADSRDAHQVKLVEACRRGFEATGDPWFVAAGRRVTSQD